MWFVKIVIRLRYRVRIHGLETIAKKGREKILFLPNHPALIDPIILMGHFYGPFQTRALADNKQIDRFFIRWLAKRANVLKIPDIAKVGTSAVTQVRQVISECVNALGNGDNLILYPSGRIYRTNHEEIRGNSAVERILQEQPGIRVVLVRTRGLWGSRFSWADGHRPMVAPVLKKGIWQLLLSGLFFLPRRQVDIELVEPSDFPRTASRSVINSYLENFYNEVDYSNCYVPYSIWERGGTRLLEEVAHGEVQGDPEQAPPATRQLVQDYLAGLAGMDKFDDQTLLGEQLGLDSLARADVILWLGQEFGFHQADVDSLRTVGDVMLAACGQAVVQGTETVSNAPAKWFKRTGYPGCPDGLAKMTIPQAFLHQARQRPNNPIFADSTGGVKTYRDVLTGIFALQREITNLPGDYVGIMLPASAAAGVILLAVQLAGKIPVMINWTLGSKNLKHCCETVPLKKILTSEQLVARVKGQGIDLNPISDSFIFLEEIARGLTLPGKLSAALQARFCLRKLERAQVAETAVLLFTSGSENIPKVVPLTHRNMLTNVQDAYECFTVDSEDSILGILPPFHSFGLTVSVLLGLTLAIPVVYYPNPVEGGVLGEIIDKYKVSILVGTPTFLLGIVRASKPEQLKSLRLVVSGAEKCPQRTYAALARCCPQTKVLEGYGATECSPVISVNRQSDPHPGTIGKVLNSLEYALVDPQTIQPVQPGQPGMLLVRGPSVFDGYLHYDGNPPFVDFQGYQWYRTGDLVVEDEKGILTFAGRLKRFVKLGGEMISLPAIEAVLDSHLVDEQDDGPVLAIAPRREDDRPELVLFTVKQVDREQVNTFLRQAGLSGLHNVREVVTLEQLPLLGTGKVDYRSLTEMLQSE
ncbi:MAG: AMP-binding protein [Sedimentisphaerales bacterium]|nr:AMP-binding protein [Sedimentisphaerales bacterium]